MTIKAKWYSSSHFQREALGLHNSLTLCWCFSDHLRRQPETPEVRVHHTRTICVLLCPGLECEPDLHSTGKCLNSCLQRQCSQPDWSSFPSDKWWKNNWNPGWPTVSHRPDESLTLKVIRLVLCKPVNSVSVWRGSVPKREVEKGMSGKCLFCASEYFYVWSGQAWYQTGGGFIISQQFTPK